MTDRYCIHAECTNKNQCDKEEHCLDLHKVRETRFIESLPLPVCCDAASCGLLVYPGFEKELGWGWYIDRPPHIRAVHPAMDGDAIRVGFCPGCGEPFPELVEKEVKPEPICKPDPSECYCETCAQSGYSCGCYPPHAGMQINPLGAEPYRRSRLK